MSVPTSEEDCIEALLRAADELGESPTKAQYEEKHKAGLETFEQDENGGWTYSRSRSGSIFRTN